MLVFNYSKAMEEYRKENNVNTNITKVVLVSNKRNKKYFKFQLVSDNIVYKGLENEQYQKNIVSTEKVSNNKFIVLSGYGQLSGGIIEQN